MCIKPFYQRLMNINGSLFPPLWLISIFWKSDNKYERAWRKVNIVSSIIVVSLMVLTGILYLVAITYRDDNKDPSWEIPSQIIQFYSNYDGGNAKSFLGYYYS